MTTSKKANSRSSTKGSRTAGKKSTTKSPVKKAKKSTVKPVKKATVKSGTKRPACQREKITVAEIDFENPESVQAFYDQQEMLTEKEVLFCFEYLDNGMIGKKAYSEIYGATHLPTCAVQASKLIRKPKIRLFLRRELDNRASRLGISSDWVANKYKVWAEGWIGDFIEIKRISGIQHLFLKGNLEELSEEQKSCIKSIEPTKDGHIKVTMIDQKAALDSLSKMLGYTSDKLQIEQKVGVTLTFDSQDKDA